MLHTKFKGNLSSGSEEKDFLSFFTIYEQGAIFVMRTGPNV